MTTSTDTDGLVEAVSDAIEQRMGPVFGSPEYLADPVKLARAEKRRRDTAMAYAKIALECVDEAQAARIAVLEGALERIANGRRKHPYHAADPDCLCHQCAENPGGLRAIARQALSGAV